MYWVLYNILCKAKQQIYKTHKNMKKLLFTLTLLILIYCFIIVMLLGFYYPREMKRVAGPDKMVAILKYGPSLNTHPMFILLLPIIGTYNNCNVFVDIEKNDSQISFIDITSAGDLPEDYDESQIIWRNGGLVIISEHSGKTNKWKFKQ